MKKTNKTFKRFAAITSASLLAACAMAPVAFNTFAEGEDAGSSTPSYSITIDNSVAGHTYKAYQIFIGDLKTETGGKTVLSNIQWGNGVTGMDGVAATIAEGLTDANINDFIASLSGKLNTSNAIEPTDDTYTINVPAAGYYLVVDETNTTVNGTHDAYSSYILKVLGSETIAPKSAKPTVDKQVQDETADAEEGATDGWGETADHAINEQFDFKLIATIPDDSTNLGFYETYKLIFNDTLSKGVVFDTIKEVKVNGNTVTSGYETTAIAGDTAKSFTVTIADLISLLEEGDTLGKDTIEVIYTAHLDANAYVNTETGNTTNKNDVFLQYSNNPNYSGSGEETLGETPKDTVWVYTYRVNNTKVNGSVAGKPALEGAGFTLYNGDTAIKLIDNEDGTYTVADQTATTGVVTEMVSNAEGKFDIIGLDAGEYVLKETTVPQGFNKCDDKTVKISATHIENDDETDSTVTLSSDSTMSFEIENKAGASLPGTGGIGTTIFYLGGGAMAAIGGVYLISKRRMKKSEE